MKELWSRRIKNLEAYVPGEQPRDRKYIKLNTNENPYPPSPKALEAIRREAGEALRLYPDPECTELIEALALRFEVEKDEIFVGNGSDEVLSMCFPAFFNEDSEIFFADITYSFYPVYAELYGIPYRTVALNDDYTLPVEPFLQPNGGVIIANPNAPTSVFAPLEGIERIAAGNPDSVVIVDEAYIDFGGETAMPLIKKYPNLLVVGTTSKSYSLAGLRVGWAVGCKNLIAALNTVKNSINSYTLDRLAIAGAAAAVADRKYFNECTDKIIATRARAIAELEKIGFLCLESSANFIFASPRDMISAEKLFSALRERGILVRYFKKTRIDNFLRISVGTDEDMDALTGAIRDILRK